MRRELGERSLKLVFLLVMMALVAFISCSNTKSNKNKNLALAYLLSTQNNPAAQQSGGVATSTSVSAASSVQSSVQGGSVAFLKDTKGFRELLAKMRKNGFVTEKLEGEMIPTTVTASNGSCSASSCKATLNGTLPCKIGTTSQGTMTITNLVVSMTFSISGTSPSSSSPWTLEFDEAGDITMNNCAFYQADYMNYPNYVSGVASGKITINSKMKQVVDTLTSTTDASNPNAFDSNIAGTWNYDVSTVATNLKVGSTTVSGNAEMKLNFTPISSTIVMDPSGISCTSSGSCSGSLVINEDDKITGSVTATGNMGDGNINFSKTYSNTDVKYTATCDISSGSCTIK